MPAYPPTLYIMPFYLHLTLLAYNAMIINNFECVGTCAFYLHCHLHDVCTQLHIICTVRLRAWEGVRTVTGGRTLKRRDKLDGLPWHKRRGATSCKPDDCKVFGQVLKCDLYAWNVRCKIAQTHKGHAYRCTTMPTPLAHPVYAECRLFCTVPTLRKHMIFSALYTKSARCRKNYKW